MTFRREVYADFVEHQRVGRVEDGRGARPTGSRPFAIAEALTEPCVTVSRHTARAIH